MASRLLWSTVFGDVFSNLNYLLMKILNVFYDLLSLLMSSLIYVIWWSSVLGDILSNLCYLLKNILTSCLLWSTAIFVNLWSTVYGDFFSTIRFLFKKKPDQLSSMIYCHWWWWSQVAVSTHQSNSQKSIILNLLSWEQPLKFCRLDSINDGRVDMLQNQIRSVCKFQNISCHCQISCNH